MSCFAQTSSGDLDISTGTLRIVQDADECSAIKLTNRFRLFLGEWFLDTRIGIPYYQTVFIKNPDLQAVAQLFKRVMMQTPNIKNVLNEGIDFVPALRTLMVSFRAQTFSGAVISGGPGLPFIVEFNNKGTA